MLDYLAIMGPAFRILAMEPSTGVAIATDDGRFPYMNEQFAQMLVGPGARAADYIGRPWAEYMPQEWVEERLGLARTIPQTRRPVLLRTIWRGYQVLSWITHIPHDETPTSTGDGERKPELFMVVSRRVPSDESGEVLAGGAPYDEVDSKVARLGRLSVLSPEGARGAGAARTGAEREGGGEGAVPVGEDGGEPSGVDP